MNLKSMVERIHSVRPFTPYSLHMIFFPLPILILGAYLAPSVSWFLLGLLIIAYWVGLEMGVHNLDLSTGFRPKPGKRWYYAPWNLTTRGLWETASNRWGVVGMVIGLALAIYLVVITHWWLIFFVLIMLAIGVGYGKDIWPFHTYTGFGLGYGFIPCLGSYLLQCKTFDLSQPYFWGVVVISVAIGIASSVLLSYLPRAVAPISYASLGLNPTGKRKSASELESKAMTMKAMFIMFGTTWVVVIGVILMKVGG